MSEDPRIIWAEAREFFESLEGDIRPILRALHNYHDKVMAIRAHFDAVQSALVELHEWRPEAEKRIARDVAEKGPVLGSTIDTYGSMKRGSGGGE